MRVRAARAVRAVAVTTSVLIAGAGPAALETALGLRTLAANRVALTLLAPDAEYVDRPMSVAAPFAPGVSGACGSPTSPATSSRHVIQDTLASVDARARVGAPPATARQLGYDALVVATGATAVPAIEPALTFRGPGDVEAVRALVRDVLRGNVRRLAFVVPPGPVWPLPLYELALMTAERAQPAQPGFELHLVTPEDATACHLRAARARRRCPRSSRGRASSSTPALARSCSRAARWSCARRARGSPSIA